MVDLTQQNNQVPGTVTATITGNVTVVQPTHDNLNANVNLQVNNTDVAVANPVPVKDIWTVALTVDEDANDSDKTITVTASQLWQILSIRVELVTTATVGARQIEIQVRDTADDIVLNIVPGLTQAASLTHYYSFAPSFPDLTSVRDTNYVFTPIHPTLLLPAGYDLRIWDNNAVDAAADDMDIQIMYAYKAV